LQRILAALLIKHGNKKYLNMSNQGIPHTHFDYFHCHKWSKSIRGIKDNPDYLVYWARMIKKIEMISEMILDRIKDSEDDCMPSLAEVDKHNNLFKDDVATLLSAVKVSEGAEEGIANRIEENSQIIKCALIMRNIANKYSRERLHEIIQGIKEEFVERLNAQRKQNLRMRIECMCADHDLTKKKIGNQEELIFYNCPIFGVFKFLGLVDISQEFCILCEAHGKREMQGNISSPEDAYLSKSLSKKDNYCAFVIHTKPIF